MAPLIDLDDLLRIVKRRAPAPARAHRILFSYSDSLMTPSRAQPFHALARAGAFSWEEAAERTSLAQRELA